MENPPEARPGPGWNYRDVAAVTALAVFGQVFLVSLFSLLAILLVDSSGQGWLRTTKDLMNRAAFVLPLQLAWWALVFWMVYRIVRARDERPFRQAIGWTRPRLPLGVYTVAGIALALSVTGLAWLLPLPRHKLPIEQLLLDPSSAFLMAGFGILVAPLIEELLFRGFLYPVVAHAHGAAAAVGITAVVFSILHAPQYGWAWQNVALLAYVGVVFGAVRAVSGSLVPSTLLHAAYNFTLFAGLYVSTNRFQDF